MGACLAPDGPYHVAGLGPVFWSALFQAARRARRPGWTPAVRRRVAAARPGPLAVRATGRPPSTPALSRAYERIQALTPEANALHVDHFLTLVASMPGRDLWQRDHREEKPARSRDAVRQVRGQAPLRRRLKERGEAIARAQEQMEAGLAQKRRRADRRRR